MREYARPDQFVTTCVGTALRPLTDVLAGVSVAACVPVRLGPWDVRVFVSDAER